jgi:hypothetical protein
MKFVTVHVNRALVPRIPISRHRYLITNAAHMGKQPSAGRKKQSEYTKRDGAELKNPSTPPKRGYERAVRNHTIKA